MSLTVGTVPTGRDILGLRVTCRHTRTRPGIPIEMATDLRLVVADRRSREVNLKRREYGRREEHAEADHGRHRAHQAAGLLASALVHHGFGPLFQTATVCVVGGVTTGVQRGIALEDRKAQADGLPGGGGGRGGVVKGDAREQCSQS